MKKAERKHQLSKSTVVERIPLACSSELAAVEFLEGLRWGNTPACVHCGSVNVYKMTDAKTGERNKRFLWRCRDCAMQYTVRINTVYSESRIELRHWCYAFWRAATAKKGVAALELKRHCQISYKSALFMMNRIRFAMAPDVPSAAPLSGTVEVDETYVGGKPRVRNSTNADAVRQRLRYSRQWSGVGGFTVAWSPTLRAKHSRLKSGAWLTLAPTS